jgi:hypothetical protein
VTLVRGAVLCALASVAASCAAGPVELDQPSVPDGQRAACERLVDALPDHVADLERREVEPADALGAAWGDPAIELTCGVGRPEDYDPAGGCTTVNGIDWYIPQEQLDANGERDLTMTTINRDVAVEVRMPGDYWPPATTLADLSSVVADHTERTGRCL